MIISKTPFRISFFGGGTDYPVWYKENTGSVLSTTIDKYCYITCRLLPPFFEHKHRIVYSKIENVKEIKEIQHPAVRAILDFCKIDKGVEIHHDSDLPARSGLGSSSSFTVGLLHSLYALKGYIISEHELAEQAIYMERDVLNENVGSQDQIAVAYGGCNKIFFHKDDEFVVEPITVGKDRLKVLEDHLMLIFTGLSRFASDIAHEQIKNTPQKKEELKTIHQMVDEAIDILNKGKDITKFGELLNKAWELKKNLSEKISSSGIDDIYNKAINAGAIGGKLLGAGGGGFMLLFAPPQRHQKIREALKGLLEVDFAFDYEGSRIIHYTGQ